MLAIKRTLLLAFFALGLGAATVPVMAINPQYDLLKAVEEDDINEATDLLTKGANPDTRRRSDQIPAILIADEKGNLAMLKLLLDHLSLIHI